MSKTERMPRPTPPRPTPPREGIASVGVLDATGIHGLLGLAVSAAAVIASTAVALTGNVALAFVIALIAVAAAWLGVASVVSKRRIELTTSLHLHRLEARRADQVSVLSHEIRTPLAVILGSAELLAEQAPGPLTEQIGRASCRERVF